MDYDISLSKAELLALLARERIAVIASVNPDGSAHAAPVWPIMVGDDVHFETELASRKAKNLLARPGCSFVVGLGPWGPSAVLAGRAVEVTDEQLRAKVREITAIRFYGTVAHPGFKTIERQYKLFGGSVVFRLEPERVASWDYEKMPESEWILPYVPGQRR
jgi:hypothetical protein